ncbi:MAG: DUF3618 domain-containing protein [Myxococcaceae bacterium]
MADEARKLLGTPGEVRAEMERARAEISASALALRSHMERTTDWRAWVRKKPEVFILGAFAIGFLIGYRR